MWKLGAIFLVLAYVNADQISDATGAACSCKASCDDADLDVGITCPTGDGQLCCNAAAAGGVLNSLRSTDIERLARSNVAKDAVKRLARIPTVKRLARSNAFKRLARSSTFKRMARNTSLNDVKRFARSNLARDAYKRMARAGTFKRLARSNTFKRLARSNEVKRLARSINKRAKKAV